jgi:hypothetical protein
MRIVIVYARESVPSVHYVYSGCPKKTSWQASQGRTSSPSWSRHIRL